MIIALRYEESIDTPDDETSMYKGPGTGGNRRRPGGWKTENRKE